jgi:hypothetical protein
MPRKAKVAAAEITVEANGRVTNKKVLLEKLETREGAGEPNPPGTLFLWAVIDRLAQLHEPGLR